MDPLLSGFIIPVIFGIIMCVVHYYSDYIGQKLARHKTKWLSFASGISIAYLFLVLFPELYKGVQSLSKLVFIYVLIGFVMFHLTEKYIYQHAKRNQIMREIKEAHSITFFIYHLIVGIVIVRLTGMDAMVGLLFFMPLALHTAVGNLSLREIHKTVTENNLIRIFLSLSTLIGIFIAYYMEIRATVFYALLAFIIGAFLYIVIREEIPKERQGKPAYFITGLVLYLLIIIIVWFVI